MVDKKTLVLSISISFIVTLITVVLIANFVPNLFQPSVPNQSQLLDDELIEMTNGSMEPTIHLGDYVKIDRNVLAEDIHAGTKDAEPPGDLVVYQGSTNLQVARVNSKSVQDDGRIVFLLHSDANLLELMRL